MPGGMRVEGLKELRAGLRKVGPEYPKALRVVHKTIADEAARRSQAFARARGGVQAKAAGGIAGSASQREARVNIGGVLGPVAFFGAKRHTGWYAKHRYANSPRQHDPWVGNSWDVAVAGTGPIAINDALAQYLPEMLEEFGRMIDDLTREAFPG